MKEGKFFYNYNVDKAGCYNKFGYGVMSIKVDESKDIVDEAWEEIKSAVKKDYPTADNINFTAFNRV